MTGEHQPRPALAHYASLLAPATAVAGREALSRDRRLRLERGRAALRHRRRAPTMRALLARPGSYPVWGSAPEPGEPGEGEALVRPLAVATCDLDRPLMLGHVPFPLPLHLGHECVAEVVSVGAGVASLRPGQRVVVPFQISCGSCGPCRLGHTGNCTGVPPLSMFGFGAVGGHWGGAIAEALMVPFADAMLVPLPDGIDPVTAASVADNVVDGYRQVNDLPLRLAAGAPADVLILGALTSGWPFTSSVPLYAALAARALGAPTVTLVDQDPAVRRRARDLGVEAVAPDRPRHLAPAAVVVVHVGTPPNLRRGLSLTAPDGVCRCVGSLDRRGSLPLGRSYARNVTLTIGRAHARSLIPDVLELMVAGRLRPEVVTSHVAPLDRAEDAYREHCRAGAIKTILVADA